MTARRPKGVEAPTAPPESDRSGLIADSARTALASLDVLIKHSQHIAYRFRWQNPQEGIRALIALVQGTETLVTLAAMTAAASGADLRALCRLDTGCADENLRTAVNKIAARQHARDWRALADTLDFDYVAALCLWRRVFEALGGITPDPGPDGWAA